MVNNKIQKIPFRRKREQKTNYKKRLNLLKSGKQRVVIRIFNKNILAQLVNYDPNGDKIVGSAYSQELEGYGWKYQSFSNLSAAYLTGLLLAKKVKKADAILDTGLQRVFKGSKIYACLKGCVDGGMKIPYAEDVFPSEERIKGEHILNYASTSPKTQFTKVKAKDVTKTFEKAKENILKV